MKQKVIEFFQNLPKEKHVQFNEAFQLYRETPNKNVAVERSYNAGGYTERSLENLMYDLQKLHGITDVEKLEERSLKLELGNEEEEGVLQLDPDSEIPGTQEETTDVDSLKSENEYLKSENEDLQFDKEDLEFENEDLKNENEELKEEVETLKLAPKLDAQAIRVEFPFLNEKDCPDEFKILVADKITAWNKYLEIQEQIAKVEASEMTEPMQGTLAELAKEAIEAFDENQKIYDELNCYQTTGKILGVHPIFKKLQLTREVEAMTNDELIKYKSSSAKYFSVNKTALEKAKKAKDQDKVQEIEARVAERHDKLFLVNKKLGV